MSTTTTRPVSVPKLPAMPQIPIGSYWQALFGSVPMRIALALALSGGIVIGGSALMRFEDLTATGPGMRHMSAGTAAVPAASSGQIVGLTIANDGLVHLQGAKVTRVSGGTITAESEWAGGSFTWIIHADAGTKFFFASGDTASIDALSPGDYLSIDGMLATISSGSIQLQAKAIRDRSAMPPVPVVYVSDTERH